MKDSRLGLKIKFNDGELQTPGRLYASFEDRSLQRSGNE